MTGVIRRYLTRNATKRGFLGGSRPWMAVGVVLFGARLFNRFFGGADKVLYSEKLDRGKTLVISYPGSEVEVLSRERA
jgi:hypothetical protein